MSSLDTAQAAFTSNNDPSAEQERAQQWANDQFERGIQIELFCGFPPAINLEAGEAVYACLPGTNQSEDHEVPRSLDVGTLILTSERLIFLGSVKTNDIPLADLLGLEVHTDSLQVIYSRKSKPEFYSLNLELRIRTGCGRGLPIRHDMLKRAIEQAASMGS